MILSLGEHGDTRFDRDLPVPLRERFVVRR
jgi:hypothetical protein